MDQEIKKELPPKYYLDNFISVLCFTEKMYGNLLSEEEQEFIVHFRALSEDAQCLFLRFMNRRGFFFRTDTLVYPEIGSITASLDELLFRQFIEWPSLQEEHQVQDLLNVFTKPELIKLFKALDPAVRGLSQLKKGELVAQIVQNFSCRDVQEGVAALAPVIKHNYEKETELIKFLYFGHLGGEMTEFVIRDLGMVKYEVPEEDKLTPLFKSREEVEQKLAVSLAYGHFRVLRERNCPEILYSWFMGWSSPEITWCALAEPLYNRLTLKLARILERHKQPEWALEVYERTKQPPSRERRVRLLQKTGAIQEALELCVEIEAAPQNADELFFARDFGSLLRKKKKTKSTTQHLKEAEVIEISGVYRYQVEKGVMQYFSEKGHEVMYSENYLWRSLFGLVFWDIIYDQEAQAFHSPLQRAPSDLYLPHFLSQRQQQMEERLNLFNCSDDLLSYIKQVYDSKWGMGNPLVNWHENTLPLVRAACRKIETAHLKAVLMEMAGNLKENGRGFPDLFCWSEREYSFMEVKSPNDTLSARQLYWLQFFRETGISAKVMKVEWGEKN